jgi:hypothetical protein
MKYVLLGLFLVSVSAFAEQDKSHFTAQYVSEIEAQDKRQPAAEKFEDAERNRKEHDRYLRQLDRIDHIAERN